MEVVREIEESGDTPQERSKIYGLPITTVVQWVAKYGNVQVKPRKGVFIEMKNQTDKIQQLESALADANLKVRLLEKSLEIAEKEYGFRAKKNSTTGQYEIAGLKDRASKSLAKS